VLELHLNFIQALENRIDNEYLSQGDCGAKFSMKPPAVGIECCAARPENQPDGGIFNLHGINVLCTP